MLHTGESVKVRSNGSLKAVWAVQPPGINITAISDDARAFFSVGALWQVKCLWQNVFPVPPEASKKNIPPL